MSGRLRIVLFSHSADGFALAHSACEAAGHQPVAYVYARASRPGRGSGPGAPAMVAGIVDSLPPGVDLLLPRSAASLAQALPGYRPDLLLCNGFPWRIPRRVRDVARLGGINVHPSLLPCHRGPIPIHWAIRAGDRETGVTVHWMDEEFDTGRVIVQRGGVPLEDEVVPDELLARMDALTGELLPLALRRAAAGDRGEPQDEAKATYAGWMEEDFHYVDRTRTVREIHNQVRASRFGVYDPPGPVVQVNGRWVSVLRTRTDPSGGGVRIDCADGPLWIVEAQAVERAE
jgi:methionyl-tRNA formyltransferase